MNNDAFLLLVSELFILDRDVSPPDELVDTNMFRFDQILHFIGFSTWRLKMDT